MSAANKKMQLRTIKRVVERIVHPPLAHAWWGISYGRGLLIFDERSFD
jgi:hypothetical protein